MGRDVLAKDGPPEQAALLMQRLAAQRRYEEAQQVRDALEHLAGIRRSYRALANAVCLSFVAIWPGDRDGPPQARLDIVWEGELCDSLTVNPTDAALKLGQTLRALPSPLYQPAEEPVCVPQERLDCLLAVRRWFLDRPATVTVSPPAVDPGEDTVEAWRADALERLREAFSGWRTS
jgi:hypothetical protein